MEPGVPPSIISATASIIAGMSPQAFREHYLTAGLVKALVTPRGIMIATRSLEAAIGRPITAKMWAIAERQRDGRREWQRQYRARQDQPNPWTPGGKTHVAR